MFIYKCVVATQALVPQKLMLGARQILAIALKFICWKHCVLEFIISRTSLKKDFVTPCIPTNIQFTVLQCYFDTTSSTIHTDSSRSPAHPSGNAARKNE